MHKLEVVAYLVALHETVLRGIFYHQLGFCLVCLAEQLVVVLRLAVVPQVVLLLAVSTFFLESGCQEIKTYRLSYAVF